MAILQFRSEEDGIEIGNFTKYCTSLRKIDNYLTIKHSDGVYVKKTLKYYEDSTVYVIRPNQKRFWSRMQAYDDATAIVNDILNM